MKTFTTKEVATIGEGVLRLTEAQAASRSHALRQVGEDLYEIVAPPVQFKAGEVFGYDQVLPRTLARCLEEIDEDLTLESLEQAELLVMAQNLGLKPHPNTGKAKLVAAIEARQAELLEEQKAAEAEAARKAARIEELDAKGESRTPEETAELDALLAS